MRIYNFQSSDNSVLHIATYKTNKNKAYQSVMIHWCIISIFQVSFDRSGRVKKMSIKKKHRNWVLNEFYSNASRVCFYYANGLHVLRKEDINGSKCPIEGLIYADRIAEFDSLSRGGKEWPDFYRHKLKLTTWKLPLCIVHF